MTLSDNELAALRNLAAKQAGEAVDFINIADARALTDKGLAERTREGWRITGQGSALVEQADSLEAAGQEADPAPPADPANSA